ncbi:MAG: peptidylprolyl isomerase [Proteobacteria bacterium]|nr:peptidylprolyl isomerase [Pseudomonadota bacterium]
MLRLLLICAALLIPASLVAETVIATPPPGSLAPTVIINNDNKGAKTVTVVPPGGQQPAPVAPATPPVRDPENTVFLDTTYGRVVIELRPDLAPKTVARIKELVRQHFYDGLLFHRVLDGFMAQTGDPKGDGTGGSGRNLQAEFSKEPHVRGTVSMARAANPDSADSQFFICTGDASFLDGQYTAFGRVLSGMEFVDMLHKGARANNGMVEHPDKIVKMQMAVDAK